MSLLTKFSWVTPSIAACYHKVHGALIVNSVYLCSSTLWNVYNYCFTSGFVHLLLYWERWKWSTTWRCVNLRNLCIFYFTGERWKWGTTWRNVNPSNLHGVADPFGNITFGELQVKFKKSSRTVIYICIIKYKMHAKPVNHTGKDSRIFLWLMPLKTWSIGQLWRDSTCLLN